LRRPRGDRARTATTSPTPSHHLSGRQPCPSQHPHKFEAAVEWIPEEEIRRQLIAAKPGTQLPSTTPEATAFARTGQTSYVGITNETYVGSERREPGTITLEGDWRSGRQHVELRKGTGKIVVPFTAGEVNHVMQPGASGNAAVTVLLDGTPVGEARGADVGTDGVARFDRSGMLRLVVGASKRRHVLTLVATDPGLRAFVFTFGP